MGLLEGFGELTRQSVRQGRVAAGLLAALEQHPGGVAGLLQTLKGNGLSDRVSAWTRAEKYMATPQEVREGLKGSQLIGRTAQHAGVTPEVATAVLTTLLPLLLRQFAPAGNVAPQSQFGTLARELMSKFL
jgi:uncharacterized protein YidB (DUF937 family)